jgi:hypothetical protein
MARLMLNIIPTCTVSKRDKTSEIYKTIYAVLLLKYAGIRRVFSLLNKKDYGNKK